MFIWTRVSEESRKFVGKFRQNANLSSQNYNSRQSTPSLLSLTVKQLHIFLWLKLLKSTYRGTWIKRYIKESTSVSLSGSPLNAWSFLICWDNRERGSSAGSSFVFYLQSLSFIISFGESRINTHLLCVRQELQQVFEQLCSINLSFSLSYVFNNGAVGPGRKTDNFN